MTVERTLFYAEIYRSSLLSLSLGISSSFLSLAEQDVSLTAIKGEVSRFPHFVYAWFDRVQDGLPSSRHAQKLQVT